MEKLSEHVAHFLESTFCDDNATDGISSTSVEVPKVTAKDYENFLRLVRLHCDNAQSNDEKLHHQLLVARSWSVKEVTTFLGCSIYRTRFIKNQLERGNLKVPELIKTAYSVDSEIKYRVLDFLRSDEISQQLGGYRNTRRAATFSRADLNEEFDADAEVEYIIPERLMLCTMGEAFSLYKQLNPDDKIHRTAFFELRPGDVKLLCMKPRHVFACCIKCVNIDLLFKASGQLDIREALHVSTCDWTFCDKEWNNQLRCAKGDCRSCSGSDQLRRYLTESLIADEKTLDSNISYKQWISKANNYEYTIVSSSVFEYIEVVIERMKFYKLHQYTAQCQRQFLTELKKTMNSTSLIIQMDFAENIECITQKEIQAKFYNREHISMFTVVVYKMVNHKLCHNSYAIVSDDLHHDVFFVLMALSKIRAKGAGAKQSADSIPGDPFENVEKIHYFTDGARQHFKSKHSLWLLSNHKAIFGCQATWNYFASGHGKSACDGIGGVLKSALRRYVLRENKYDMTRRGIVTHARDVIDWDIMRYGRFPTLINLDYIDDKVLLKFRQYKTLLAECSFPVKDISLYHCFRCLIPGEVLCHFTSQTVVHKESIIGNEKSAMLVKLIKKFLSA